MTKVYTSGLLRRDPDAVWALVGDFGAAARWVSDIGSCQLDGGGPTTVGVLRRVRMAAGYEVCEQLIALDAERRELVYTLVPPSPVPVRDLRVTVRVTPATRDEATFVEWSADFSADAADTAAAVERMAGFHRRLLDDLAAATR